MEIFGYQFFQNALIGSLLASVACGIIGTYVVTRRLVFISGGITHSSFGGVGLGMYLGINPLLTAFAFAAVSALGVQCMGMKKEVREDSAIALFWILGMSLGIIFCFLSPGYNTELSTYLFGNILTVTSNDIAMLAIISALLLLLNIPFYRTIVLVAFDREFAAARGVPVALFERIMMLAIATTIVATLRLVGVVLVISMLTVPQMTAMLFTFDYKKIMVLSVIFGFSASLMGLLLSYAIDTPSGATIVLCSILIYATCKACITFIKKLLNL
ncbi:MAG: metal ABC transporter permease [Bacteroidaceae bacterium]|nr:metal ABC transporter permease [Bacteroidaceae bacterium]